MVSGEEDTCQSLEKGYKLLPSTAARTGSGYVHTPELGAAVAVTPVIVEAPFDIFAELVLAFSIRRRRASDGAEEVQRHCGQPPHKEN